MPNRHIPDLVKELENMFGDKKPKHDELVRLAKELNSIPHWFEADYDERPAATPGYVEYRLVPGTLKDLGPVTPEELTAHLTRCREAALAAAEARRRISFRKMCYNGESFPVCSKSKFCTTKTATSGRHSVTP